MTYLILSLLLFIFGIAIGKYVKILDNIGLKTKDTAEWIVDDTTFPGPGLSNYVCSKCHKLGGTWKSDISLKDTPDYCGWCGRKIKKEGDS